MVHDYFFFLLSEVVNAEHFYKPVPKPRSGALDKLLRSDDTCKDTDVKVSRTVDRDRSPSDDSHSDRRNSRSHENLQCVSGATSPDETLFNDTPTASIDSLSQGDNDDGNSNSSPQTLGSVHK